MMIFLNHNSYDVYEYTILLATKMASKFFGINFLEASGIFYLVIQASIGVLG